MIFLLKISEESNLYHEWDLLRTSIRRKFNVSDTGNIVNLFPNRFRGSKLLIYNISLNSILFAVLGNILGYNVIYVSHEPWKYWQEIKGSEKKNRLKYISLNFINIILFLVSSQIHVLSREGYRRVSKFFLSKTNCSRILLEKGLDQPCMKVYDICWIGACSEQKGFSNFINLVKKNKLKAVICTNSEVNLSINIPVSKYKDRQTADDILAKSKGVAIFHPHLTQSGVAPQALRNGCLIVTTNMVVFAEYKNTSDVVVTVDWFLENQLSLDNESFVACLAAFRQNHDIRLLEKYYSDL
jgi:hypothetical protein